VTNTTTMAFVQTKLTGSAAERLKRYAESRRISANGAAVEMILRGLDDLEAMQSPEESNAIQAQLNGMERRLAATVLAMRADMDALQAEMDTSVVMLDALVKSILVHLPPPPEEDRDGILASASQRYEKWLSAIKKGFVQDRPQVLLRIAEELQKRVGDVEA
jgi:hypothetical protein